MKYEVEEKGLNLVELLDYANIPEINAYFADALKTRQKKSDGFNEAIENYREAKKHFMNVLYVDRPDKTEPTPLYFFQLTKYGKDDWRYYDIYPAPVDISPFEVLPKELMVYMGNTAAHPSEIVREDRVWSPKLGKYLELCYVHYSTTFILGTVRDSNYRPKSAPKRKKKKVKVLSEAERLKINPELGYAILFNCWSMYPTLMDGFIQDFMLDVLAERNQAKLDMKEASNV